MVDEVRAIEVGLVARRDHMGQANFVLRGEAGDEAAIGSALCHDGDRARLGGRAKTAGPQRHIVDEVYETQAVRPEQRYIVLASQRCESCLVIGACVTGFGKARGQDHRVVHIGRREIRQCLIDCLHRHHQQREVDRRADGDT